MKLLQVMDSLDGVPEEIRENYEEVDGKFHLKVEGLVQPKDADQFDELKGALTKQRSDTQAERTKRQEIEAAVEALGGIDGIKDLKAQQEDTERKRLEGKGEWDTLRGQMSEQHDANIAKKDTRIKQLTERLDKEIRGRQVMEAIAKHDGNPTLLKPILMQATKLTGADDDDAELGVEVHKDGVMLVDGDGKALSVEGYVLRLREDEAFAGAFKGTGQSGGGGSGDQLPGAGRKGDGKGNGGGIPPELASLSRSQMTPRQKVDVQNALADKHGGDRDKALNEFMQIPL